MARKKRKSSAGNRKKSRAATKKAARRGSKTRRLRKRRLQRPGNKVERAYRVIMDTIKGTDDLRNKMEPTGTSETE
jgi:hypothetical protein